MGAWLRRHTLRVLFTAALACAVLGLFMEAIFGWVPEAHHAAIDSALVAAVVLSCGAVVGWIVRRRPDFLQVPPGLSPAFWVARSLCITPLVFVLLAIAFGLLAFAELRFKGDPSDPQYGVSVAWAMVWYPAILTPLLSVLAVTRAGRRAHRERAKAAA